MDTTDKKILLGFGYVPPLFIAYFLFIWTGFSMPFLACSLIVYIAAAQCLWEEDIEEFDIRVYIFSIISIFPFISTVCVVIYIFHLADKIVGGFLDWCVVFTTKLAKTLNNIESKIRGQKND